MSDEYTDPNDNIDPFDPRLIGASRHHAVGENYGGSWHEEHHDKNGDYVGPPWPEDMSHHLHSNPAQAPYSAGYHAARHPAFVDVEDSLGVAQSAWTNAGGESTGSVDFSSFEDGWMDSINGIPHMFLEPKAHQSYLDAGDSLRMFNPKRLRDHFDSVRNPTVPYTDPDEQQDPFDPRLLGASLRLDMADLIRLAGDGMSWEDTMRHIDEALAGGEPEDHSDYSTDYYHEPDDDDVSDDDEHERMDHYHDKWFDQLPDSHKRWVRETNDEAMLFDFQRYYDHHANEGAPYTLTPLPEHEKMRQQRGYMKRMRQLEPHLDQYLNPEGGGRTASLLDYADVIRLAGDGMSWEDTMAHIDSVLAEGDNPTHQDDELAKGVPSWYMAHDDDDGPYDDPSRECDACGAVDNKDNMYVTDSEKDGSLQWHCDPCAERIYQRKRSERGVS